MVREPKFSIGDKIIYRPIGLLPSMGSDRWELIPQHEWLKGVITKVRPSRLFPQSYNILSELGKDILKHDDTGLELDLSGKNDIEWWIR